MVYSEPDLIIPALVELDKNSNGLTTTQLISKLRTRLNPTGHDIEIISGRKDDYFSQKVRNLKSHDTLTGRGLATYDGKIWKSTDKGKDYLSQTYEDEKDSISISLEEQGFRKTEIKKKAKKDFSDIIIEEGALEKRSVPLRKRSDKLRKIAIQEYKIKNDGKLPCEVCGFDFKEKYGEIGENFIEIHHKELVSEMDIAGSKQKISEALKKVAPLCSNCHKIIHRNKGKMLSIDELRRMIKDDS